MVPTNQSDHLAACKKRDRDVVVTFCVVEANGKNGRETLPCRQHSPYLSALTLTDPVQCVTEQTFAIEGAEVMRKKRNAEGRNAVKGSIR